MAPIPSSPSTNPRHFSALGLAVLAVALALLGSACMPDIERGFLPIADLKPPMVMEAGPEGSRLFTLRFDEAVSPLPETFLLEPGGPLGLESEGEVLRVLLPEEQRAGAEYRISGEVQDEGGNGARFLFSFVGWNENPAQLRIAELQTSRNSSTTRPHRDFAEFEVLEEGDLGGLEFLALSSAKAARYRFPAARVHRGEFVVLHLAPQGLPEEMDETDSDLARSGGVDATPQARDLWSAAGGLPDESGILILYDRPGGAILDGVFYADEEKTGPLAVGRLADAAEELQSAGNWTFAGEPAWEDAFRWKPSSARSIQRLADEPAGAGAWLLSATSAQSPGEPGP